MTTHDVKTTLKLISARRNAIVHESEIDPMTGDRKAIDRSDVSNATDFIEKCGSTIVKLVK
jgi:hypothetical protein